jgi:hypothetical protein
MLLSACSYRFHPAECDLALSGKLSKQSTLDSTLAETSGLIWMDGHFWTFNDSGGEACLYQVDASSGSIIRKTVVRNAFNVDWEDISMDANYIYVADVGNNFHTRDTLVVYRISRNKLLKGEDEVEYEGLITLSFEEDVRKNSKGFSSHDCEALLVHGDSLYLFSKDWVEQSTSVYAFPALPGHYHLRSLYRYEADMLVTGADQNSESREVVLVGYRNYLPVLIRYRYESDPGKIQCGGRARFYPMHAGRQVEGICFDRGGNLYISAEQSLQKPALFRVGRR